MFANTLDREFNKNFMISFGVHCLLLLLCLAGGQIVSKVFKNNDVEVINASVRVDVVGMPKFTVQELKKMQAEPVIENEPEVAKGAKEETKKEAEDVINKDDLVIQEASKKKKASFLNMLNDYSNKKVTTKKVQEKGSQAGKGSKNLDSLIIEGNRLSKGSALVGEYTDEQNSEFSAYVQNLPGVIRPYWKLPSYLMEQELKCKIKIYLSPTGQLLKLELTESSGQPEFDARAEKAVRDATFPKPSESVGTRLTSSGILLKFPL